MKKMMFLSELLERNEMKRALQDTGAGLESIRFAVSDNLDQLQQQIREAKEDLKYYGDPALYLHGPFLDLNPMSYDSAVRQVTMDRFNACYEAAVELGAEGVVYHSCMIPQIYFTEGWAERMAEFWNEFLEGKSGIPVRMENVLDREIHCFVEVAREVKHPDFGLCVDIGHAHCYSEYSVLEWVRQAGPFLGHVHIHDNNGVKDQHLGLGRGNLPYREILTELQRLPQSLTWTIEGQTLEDDCETAAILQQKCFP
ncbi:MAG: sugar phosphate isomerase/epimerase family protein [Lachnospiraceae bacterium]|nr:sugar phosphate isomerase/epimerase family protein [Lachnospiraceae bacterium]